MPFDAKALKNPKVLIGGGVVVVGGIWYYKRQQAAAAAAAGTTTAATTDSGSLDTGATGGAADTSGDGGFGGGWGSGYSNLTGASSTLPNGATQPSTNASWVQDATSYLEGLGYDTQTVAAALGAYTQGGALTSAQSGIVQSALGAFGPTPTGVPLSTGTAPPTATSGTKSGVPIPGNRTITVGKGETQKEIINAAGISYSDFTSLNPGLAKKGSQVHSGQKVII